MSKQLFSRTTVIVVICLISLFPIAIVANAQEAKETLYEILPSGGPSETSTAPQEDVTIEAMNACAICDPGCTVWPQSVCADEVKQTGATNEGPWDISAGVCSTDSNIFVLALYPEGPFSSSITAPIPNGATTNFYVKGLKGGSATEVINWPSGYVCLSSSARVPCCCVPWTVVEPVTFNGPTDCSGFDSADGTPWLSVAKGGTTKAAEAIIPSGTNLKNVTLTSMNTGIATVSPARPKQSPQILTVKGVAPGETAIEAKTSNVCSKKMNVAVYEPRTVKVVVHVVTAQGCASPKLGITQNQLESALNAIWDQAAIRFNVTIGKAPPPVAYDQNGNCILDQFNINVDPAVLGPEVTAIMQAVKDPSPGVINVYYVTDLQSGQAGFTVLPGRDTFIGINQIGYSTVANLTAHEIGHSLDLPDCSETTYCDLDPTNLMVDNRSLSNPTPCFMNKIQWDTSNQKAGTL